MTLETSLKKGEGRKDFTAPSPGRLDDAEPRLKKLSRQIEGHERLGANKNTEGRARRRERAGRRGRARAGGGEGGTGRAGARDGGKGRDGRGTTLQANEGQNDRRKMAQDSGT